MDFFPRRLQGAPSGAPSGACTGGGRFFLTPLPLDYHVDQFSAGRMEGVRGGAGAADGRQGGQTPGI